MKNSSLLTVISILYITLTVSCFEKPEKNITKNYNAIPTYTPLVLTYGRFGVAEAIQSNDESDAYVRFNLFNGSRNQFWRFEKRKKGYIIRSYLNRKVLSINPKDSSVIQQTFNGNKNQFWIISGKKDSLLIKSKAINKYLTIELNKHIVLKNYSSELSPQWSFQTFQKIREEKDSCNCAENFEFIRNKIESSYAGFQDKVNSETKKEYNDLLAYTKLAIKSPNSTLWCYNNISYYLKFFNDGHIQFTMVSQLHQPNDASLSKNDKSKIDKNKMFSLKSKDDSTLVLTLPSFKSDYKSFVDELITKNRKKILNTPYLIIDVRGNGGGNDPTFSRILPLLYTNPYFIYGTDIIASADNIIIYESTLKILKILKDTAGYKFYEKTLVQMKKNPGKFALRTEDRVVHRDSILTNPRKIGILINGRCGSSTEEFLLNARESKKVVLFGQPTSGTLDYSNVLDVPCPSLIFNFGYATTRRHWLPKFSIDRDKIQPNIYLSDSVNWIEEAVKHLKNNR